MTRGCYLHYDAQKFHLQKSWFKHICEERKILIRRSLSSELFSARNCQNHNLPAKNLIFAVAVMVLYQNNLKLKTIGV